MSEGTNYNQHNEVKYERILRKQCKSLENMYTSYKYRPYHCAQASKYVGTSNNKKWLGELKKHLRIASRRKPYFNIVISLLNISDGNELISNDIYGIDHQLITNMLGDVVTDPIERRLRVWEVRDTLEKIACSFGFDELAEEVYRNCKDHDDVKKLMDMQVYYDEEDGIMNFDFVYQWYIVNIFQIGSEPNHPKLVKFDRLISGEVAEEYYKKEGVTPDSFKRVMGEYFGQFKELMEDEYVREACILKLSGAIALQNMDEVATKEYNRKISKEANKIINEKRMADLDGLWK